MPEACDSMKKPDFSPQVHPPFALRLPKRQTLPVVVTSAHSGNRYPDAFLAAAAVDRTLLRRSEDWAMHRLAGPTPSFGAPLLSASFPRTFLDANREPFELDPTMFRTELPDYVNRASRRVQAGLGTVHRYATDGAEIYAAPLEFGEVLLRIEHCYLPFHAQLERLIRATVRRFGLCILLDCHSMPSLVAHEHGPSGRPIDFVLGDLRGVSCDAGVTDRAHAILARRGWSGCRNDPYAGAFITRHYGRPDRRVHALQLEISRGLYMDEDQLTAAPGFAAVSNVLCELIAGLGTLGLAMTRPPRRQPLPPDTLDSPWQAG